MHFCYTDFNRNKGGGENDVAIRYGKNDVVILCGKTDVVIRCGKNDVCHMISVKGFELCCWENNVENMISEE